MLDPKRPFVSTMLTFQRRVAELGIVNSLSQLLIKCTAPGVPDFYQGTEFWDLSLVDPDNRRPVDYARRAERLRALPLASPAAATELVASRHDGRIKMYTMARALALRGARRAIFDSGSYVPLDTAGPQADSIFAFARRHDSGTTVTCVPRLIAGLEGAGTTPPLGPGCWDGTTVRLPADLAGCHADHAFTGVTLSTAVSAHGQLELSAADLFAHFPVALLALRT